jgi:hypothetical protein
MSSASVRAGVGATSESASEAVLDSREGFHAPAGSARQSGVERYRAGCPGRTPGGQCCFGPASSSTPRSSSPVSTWQVPVVCPVGVQSAQPSGSCLQCGIRATSSDRTWLESREFARATPASFLSTTGPAQDQESAIADGSAWWGIVRVAGEISTQPALSDRPFVPISLPWACGTVDAL